ncbi:hypothetical protein L204_101988 [Cryptococcus depauperatus]
MFAAEDARATALDSLLLHAWVVGSNKPQSNQIRNVDEVRLKQEDFEILGCLGQGQFGLIEAVKCRINGQIYAMKTIEKLSAIRAGPQLSLSLEKHIHRLSTGFKNPPAPQLLAAFQNETSLSLITTYAPCGSLWDRICSFSASGHTRLAEEEIKWWAAQMIQAIDWLHQLKYVHRDIKPHNFVITSTYHLLLTDFGSAAPLNPSINFNEPPFVHRKFCVLPIGSPDYIAPEVLVFAEQAALTAAQDLAGNKSASLQPEDIRGYDATVDWWSLGASIFEFAVGKTPFWAETIEQTYQQLMAFEGQLNYPSFVSMELQTLLQRRCRYASEIKNLSFFKGIHWEYLPKASSPIINNRPEVIDVFGLPSRNIESSDQFTFDHLLNLSCNSSMVSIASLADNDKRSQWCGWSYIPTPDSFLKQQFMIESHSTLEKPDAYMTPRQHRVSTSNTNSTPLSVNTIKHSLISHTKSRVLSEQQAFYELVQCVERSAKKRMSGQHQQLQEKRGISAATMLWRRSDLEQSKSQTPITTKNRTRHSPKSNTWHSKFALISLEQKHSAMLNNLNSLDTRLQDLQKLLQDENT